jgi:hypothetical protein
MARLSLRRWAVAKIERILTKPLATYELHVPNDLERLKRHLRKGDLLLVEGEQRVSVVIKYLTQSSWSHAAIYVGDEVLLRAPERREELRERFGDEAGHLIVEALMEGVVVSPISKYVDHNIRVCRPLGIRRNDLARVLDEVVGRIGHRYDLKNVLDLARYFLPVSLIPRRFRRQALTLGSGEPTEVICSSMLAEAFGRVGFPILPRIVATGADHRRSFVDRLLGRRGPSRTQYFRRSPTLVTPREFDLSPYFEIVKVHFVEDERFDYRTIAWAEDERERTSNAS